MIPGELKARFNLRFSTEQTIDSLKATVERILREHRVNYSLEWFISGYPFLTVPGTLSEAAIRAVQEELEITPKLSTGGGTSDGRFIAPMGAQVIELGVINATIHKANECVEVSRHRAAAPHLSAHAGTTARLLGGRAPQARIDRSAPRVYCTVYPRPSRQAACALM